ncbi:MAG: DUF2807 domain-containing protein [Lentimicrobium sp.]|mgnify:CR=1 FL=1|jgi:hypothetical protein|nr:DUF2807 domain-containing protein [Lentimicrobium sp.]MDD2528266.1 DUF2807 domain-containing protein [Lentimicrobiaceae bacterium]MDD4597561.1 DUF2807 domain-containing protein [Lentimicrobiaceae bacterium]MDY0026845.1 head GIN domain-containing protein [Lentimicrobium sp.]HAH59987.1 hypothetical protein [Bacteroidales bacterium]
MKSTFNIYSVVVFVLLLFVSCERDNWHHIHGSGPVLTEERDVHPFYDVNISIPARIYFYQSAFPELTIKAQANILDAIETRIRRGELEIGLYNGAGLGKHETIEIYISSATYRNIRFSGSVDGWAETPLNVPEMNIFISGSGTFSGEVYAHYLSSSISGSGKLWLDGEVADQFHTISGSGDIYAFDLESETADIRISGSGKVEISVDDFLYADMSGSGTIYYRGYPDVESHISGSGKIIHINNK